MLYEPVKEVFLFWYFKASFIQDQEQHDVNLYLKGIHILHDLKAQETNDEEKDWKAGGSKNLFFFLPEWKARKAQKSLILDILKAPEVYCCFLINSLKTTFSVSPLPPGYNATKRELRWELFQAGQGNRLTGSNVNASFSIHSSKFFMSLSNH